MVSKCRPMRPTLRATLVFAFFSAFVAWTAPIGNAHAAETAGQKTEAKGDAKAAKSNSKESKDSKNPNKSSSKGDAKKMTETKNPVVTMETSMGNIDIELFADKAPISVQNFLKYAEENFYSGTIFHRVIPGFMIQGGGFTEDMKQKPTHSPIKNEATNGLANTRGTLAMARTMIVDSATAQFFINVNDNDFLNHTAPNERGYGYAVFGKVISGMDVVDKIKGVSTTTKGMHENVPITPVVIKSVKRK